MAIEIKVVSGVRRARAVGGGAKRGRPRPARYRHRGARARANRLCRRAVELAWLCRIEPDLLEAMFALAVATGRDQTGSFQAWQVYELGDPRFRLDLTAVAVAEDELIGYATFLEFIEERTGCNRVLTVLPSSQEHRIGEALTRAQIAAAKARWAGGAVPWAPSGPQHDLYLSLGYEPRTASIDFHGPVQ